MGTLFGNTKENSTGTFGYSQEKRESDGREAAVPSPPSNKGPREKMKIVEGRGIGPEGFMGEGEADKLSTRRLHAPSSMTLFLCLL